jgi:hypothetical protein
LLPAIIICCAPTVFVGALALLLRTLVLPVTGPLMRSVATWIVVAALLMGSAAAAAHFNSIIDAQVKELAQDDHDDQWVPTHPRQIALWRFADAANTRSAPSTEYRSPARGAAPANADPAGRELCDSLCLQLLYDNVAGSVLVFSLARDAADPGRMLNQYAARFRIERRESCPRPQMTRVPYGSPGWPVDPVGKANQDHVLARIAGGECLIAEPALLADADVVVQEQKILLPTLPKTGVPLSPNQADLKPSRPIRAASRISIFEVRDGQARERLRRTTVEAEPLLPLFVLGPVVRMNQPFPDIHLGFLRRRRTFGAYTLREILKAKLGLKLVPIPG